MCGSVAILTFCFSNMSVAALLSINELTPTLRRSSLIAFTGKVTVCSLAATVGAGDVLFVPRGILGGIFLDMVAELCGCLRMRRLYC